MSSLKTRATTLYSQFCEQVVEAARESNIPEPAAYDALRHELRQLLLLRSTETDNRTTLWRARVRLYDSRSATDPAADSDPEAAPDAPGCGVFKGLPEVAAFLTDCATAYHAGQVVEGLDAATLAHRLKSLRPTLSRRGGNAVWRVPYNVISPMDAVVRNRAWIARVDVERVTS